MLRDELMEAAEFGAVPSGSGSSSHFNPFWQSNAASSEGAFIIEQPPMGRSKAPSDSEFSSWHDDASSLATCSAADRTITVNTQRARMGEHLKGKLEGMMTQRFENYLRIIQTLQNDIGKLAALECELRSPLSGSTGDDAASVRVSISCNEDSTFLVYGMPPVSISPGSHEGPREVATEGPSAASSCSSHGGDSPGHAESQQTAAGSDAASMAAAPDGDELLRQWVEQVCKFGMSGRCHSLTALFHFGYNAWKQIVGADEAATGHIAEEEERPREELELCREESSASAPAPEEVPAEPHPLSGILKAAHLSADCERYHQAMELCNEGLSMARLPQLSRGSPHAGASPSAASAAAAPDEDSSAATWQLLLLRANLHARSRNYDLALQDAEELISLQPTCAEGYYWQSVALQGLDHGQEALESLMSALEYDPQNPLFQHALTSLFEEISAASAGASGASAAPVGLRRRTQDGPAGDALSTTTQATHLSSRSTTPTEVSAPLSRSSSTDNSLYIVGAAFEDPA